MLKIAKNEMTALEIENEKLKTLNQTLRHDNDGLTQENCRLRKKIKEMKCFFDSAFKTAPRPVCRD